MLYMLSKEKAICTSAGEVSFWSPIVLVSQKRNRIASLIEGGGDYGGGFKPLRKGVL